MCFLFRRWFWPLHGSYSCFRWGREKKHVCQAMADGLYKKLRNDFTWFHILWGWRKYSLAQVVSNCFPHRKCDNWTDYANSWFSPSRSSSGLTCFNIHSYADLGTQHQHTSDWMICHIMIFRTYISKLFFDLSVPHYHLFFPNPCLF